MEFTSFWWCMEFNQGAKVAIERMVEAYGVKTKLALCDALGVTASALSNRQVRDSFPAEYVLKCALDTGASLRWLTYGHGEMFEQNVVTAPSALAVPRKKLLRRKLHDSETLLMDKDFLPAGIKSPLIVTDGEIQFIATQSYDEIYDGTWLVDIDGNVSVREVIRIPGNKVNVSDKLNSFDCPINDLVVIAKIIIICSPT
ncbi:Bacteriophage CI repressor helix-turn-helix domain [Serratia fonticola]|uniref:phage repressor protein CI n=1 Tax=Serratia fonticola TaxID=47917 RepID=UPI00217C706D|nr:phage repressor protein CI [Serratia fonticola]CAI0768877.1 Bacteriophage CI repressor helix-turn-helix domain [Serratia fonticola]